jgi:ADP-L-glycero-D-manno-heptose 6-epimerase
VQRGEPAKLFTSHREGIAHGEQMRDFVWVGDCVAVVQWLLANPQVSGLFNLGTGTARSFNDLAAAVFAALGRPAEITYIEMPQALRARYQYHTRAAMQRLRAAGYDAPFTALEDGVRRYVQDYLLQPDPYR